MRPVSWSPYKPLAALMLLALATGLASSASSAARLKLRCTITPRTLPAAGGEVVVRVNAGTQPVAALLATLTRPNRTADTEEMAALGNGQFEATFNIPANPGRSVQKYSLAAFARGEDPAGATAKCGIVSVKGSAEAAPFAVTSCRITPRVLPAAGGSVHIDAAVTGKRKGITVLGVLVGSQPLLQTHLIAGPGGSYRGDLVLPANTTSSQVNHNLHVVAESADGSTDSGMDCGFVSVSPTDTSARVGGIAVAGGIGGAPDIRSFRSDTLAPLGSILPFGRGFQGTVTVATADLDGDGVNDLIAATGAGAAPHVKVFSGADNEELRSFLAYAESFAGGVYVAAGDVNGDGVSDVITGAGQGSTGGHVKVFDGRTGQVLSSFLAYAPGFTGGVRVAVGDVNGDGHADIVTGTGGGTASHVKVFSGADGSVLRSFFAFDTGFTGGIHVAAGDVNGDGRAEIIVGAAAGGGPNVKVFNGATGAVLASFFAYTPSFLGGVTVATGDVDGDGKADVITGAGPGSAGGHVKVFSGATGAEIRSFLPYDAGFTGGVFVAGWK